MKKRLLSAALALAMVLTLLPVSAFAADTTIDSTGSNVPSSGGTSVQYYAANTIIAGVTSPAGWYWHDTSVSDAPVYRLVNTGFINSRVTETPGQRGNWYPLVTGNAVGYFNGSKTVIPSSFTLLASSASLVHGTANYSSSSLDINLNGHTLNITGSELITNGVASLTVTDTLDASGNRRSGTLNITGGIQVTNTTNKNQGFTLKATNVSLGSSGVISLDNTSGTSSQTLIVKLDNSVAPLSWITVLNAKADITLSNKSNIDGGINITRGATSSWSDGSSVKFESGATNGTTNGNVTIDADRSSLSVTGKDSLVACDVTVTGKGSSITVDGGRVNTVGGKATKITGTGTTVNVKNLGQIGGGLTVTGSTSAADADATDAPAVTIDNGTVNAIYHTADTLKKAIKVSLSNTATVTAASSLLHADVTVSNSDMPGRIALQRGSLTISGSGNNSSKLGAIYLGSTTNDVALKVSGSNVETDTVTYKGTAPNKLKVDLTGVDNYYAGLTLTGYVSGTASDNRGLVEGGVGVVVDPNYLHSSVGYQADCTSTTTAKKKAIYYLGTDNFQDLVNKWNGNDQKGGSNIWRLGGSTGSYNVKFFVRQMSTDKPILVVLAHDDAEITLPAKISTYDTKEWSLNGLNNTTSINAGNSIIVNSSKVKGTTDPDSVTIELYARPESMSLTSIEKVDVKSPDQNITASMTSSGITLSGAIKLHGGVGQNEKLDLVVTGNDGKEYNVVAYYIAKDKTVKFDSAQAPLSVNPNDNTLRMPNDVKKYTITSTAVPMVKIDEVGLTKTSLSHVEVDNVTVPGYSSDEAKQRLRDTIDLGGFTANKNSVDLSGCPSIRQALNARIATLTDSQVEQYLVQGQTKAFQSIAVNKGKTPTQEEREKTNYDTVQIVAYLAMDISVFNDGTTPSGMTFTLKPSYKIQVVSSTNDKTYNEGKPVVLATGTLDTSKGSQGKAILTFGVGGKFTGLTSTPNVYVHQNGTYVYHGTVDATNDALTFITLNGFSGTFVVDGTKHLVALKNVKADSLDKVTLADTDYEDSVYFDSFQSAMDQSNNRAKIDVDASYPNTGGVINVTMNGLARTVYVDTHGDNKVRTSNTTGVTVVDPTGATNDHTYTVQLTRDNIVVKPTEKPIPISTVSVTGGSVSLSASRADEGDTITVTLVPATGYTAGGITVRTDTGANVSYTATGTNTYRFVVPTGAKSITVTPSFTRTNTGVLVTVASATYGTATTTAGTNRVAVGSTVSVTVSPRSGYRTMGLYVTSDTGVSATAYRTGVNTFTFTVPSATSSVVVTPRFDVNNGTVFEDVWSTEYYSAPVAWAVGRGITDGTDTYHFSPGQSCNRVQMVTFMWRAAGRPSTAGMANPFYDVSPSMGNDFYNAILWANAKGITNGDGSTTRFNPYKTVTRAEAVTFLWRYEGKPAASTNSGFYDVPAREWYAQAVTWAVGKGITNGDGSTVRFNPNGACLRAQIVTFLYRDITGARA